MKQSFGFISCCFLLTLFSSCKHHSATPQVAASTVPGIDSLIKAKEKATYQLVTDTTRDATAANKTSPYYSVTRFYYDSASKELFKAENIVHATAKISFIAYYSGGQVVKTSAHTEFGWYNDYYLPNEQENKADGKRKSPFRDQCLQLAKAQQSIFQKKVG